MAKLPLKALRDLKDLNAFLNDEHLTKEHFVIDPGLPVQGGRTIPTPPRLPTQRSPTHPDKPDTNKKERE